MMRRTFLLLLLFSIPLSATGMEALTSAEIDTLWAASTKPVAHITTEPDGMEVIWSKWKVDRDGIMTLYGCTAARRDEFFAAIPKNQDISLSQFANTVTPRGWKKTWTSLQACPAGIPAWCCQ